MAPSPTGTYHVGNLATLLKNYAWAKHHGGRFILRLEDTDQRREVAGAAEQIMEVIRLYGLDWDEGPDKGGPYQPYRQSERLEIYRGYVDQLIDQGHAYYCFATSQELAEMRQDQQRRGLPPRYDGRYRDLPLAEARARVADGQPYVVRLKVPLDQRIAFTDLVRGKIEVSSADIDDQVILKSDGFPTYHLASVVDDHLMDISHVLRGEEWISSTPKHVVLYRALGWQPPVYAHLPVFLNPDGKGKMSKRNGQVSAQGFLDQGYLPEAMLNFLMILGWAHPEETEVLSLAEYVRCFDPADVSAKSVVFDLGKLNWLNGIYIRRLSADQLLERLRPFVPGDAPQDKLSDYLELVKDRLVKLNDFEALTAFWYRPVRHQADQLLKKSSAEQVVSQLKTTSQGLAAVTPANWHAEQIETVVRKLQLNNHWSKRQYFMLVRYAVTGQTATPPLFETMAVLGKSETLARLNQAQQVV